MNAERYTQKAIEALQSAQTLAAERDHASIMPEHLLYAMLQQEGGLVGSLFNKMGADASAVMNELDRLLNAMPRVSGGRIYLSREMEKVMSFSEAMECQYKRHVFLLIRSKEHVVTRNSIVCFICLKTT